MDPDICHLCGWTVADCNRVGLCDQSDPFPVREDDGDDHGMEIDEAMDRAESMEDVR